MLDKSKPVGVRVSMGTIKIQNRMRVFVIAVSFSSWFWRFGALALCLALWRFGDVDRVWELGAPSR